MSRQIRTGIIGFGLSGRVFHAPFLHIHPGFYISKVVERHNNHSTEVYPYVEVVRDLNDVLNDPDIELVVLCVPNEDHVPMVKRCLESGKHVVVEKPFTPTSKEADELIKLASELDKKIFVYHNRRWDGDFLFIKKLIKEDALGDVEYYESHFDRYVPEVSTTTRTWRNVLQPASGTLFDLGSHLIHQVITLFGLPESVNATVNKVRPSSNVDDYFSVELQYPTRKAVVSSDMLVKDHQLRYIVRGEKGTFTQYGIDPQEEYLNKGHMPENDQWCDDFTANYGLIQSLDGKEQRMETPPGNYMLFYNNVYDILVEGKAMAVSPEEARDVIRIIELAYESNAQKKSVMYKK